MQPIAYHSPSTAGRREKPTQGFVARLAAWFEHVAAERIDRAAFDTLTRLDDRQLRDIGLTREDVEWASKLPLSRSAAEALKRRRGPNA